MLAERVTVKTRAALSKMDTHQLHYRPALARAIFKSALARRLSPSDFRERRAGARGHERTLRGPASVTPMLLKALAALQSDTNNVLFVDIC